MTADAQIDAFAACLEAADILIAPIDAAPWIDALETELAHRLPPSFGSLLRRYAFTPFEWGPVAFFGNLGTDDPDDLCTAIRRDSIMWRVIRAVGFLQFARPVGPSYDAVCFDMRRPAKHREFPVVRLDHEPILISERIGTAQRIAPSFAALADSLLAGGKPRKREQFPWPHLHPSVPALERDLKIGPLGDAEIAALADAWIVAQHTDPRAPEYEERFWAIDGVMTLEWEHPQTCWAVILAIFERDRSEEILGILSAGSLEDLLVHHGAQFIDEVELRARQSPLFRRLLTGVWQRDMPEDIWQRVLRASGLEPPPPLPPPRRRRRKAS
jgi:hypothetical protein